MGNNKEIGQKGEKIVVVKIPCPNCKKKLMQLPNNYPLYDVQCTGCLFRAQIKTISKKPSNTFLGAGWDIMQKVLKSGYMIPPLIAVFDWEEKAKRKMEIRFYPFVPKINLKNYQLSSKARRANY